MREAEWLASRRADAAAVRIGNRLSARKIRLIGCGYARSRWDVLPAVVRDIIVATEERADGSFKEEGIHVPISPADVAYLCWGLRNASLGFGQTSLLGLLNTLYGVPLSMDLLRCIAGNPFRPAAVDPIWLTSDVLALAQGIYQDRAFERMPILADALQDAGCDNEGILNHCRGDGLHVRGCWVIDLLTGRK